MILAIFICIALYNHVLSVMFYVKLLYPQSPVGLLELNKLTYLLTDHGKRIY